MNKELTSKNNAQHRHTTTKPKPKHQIKLWQKNQNLPKLNS